MTIQSQFDTAYWLSLPTPVQALNNYSLTSEQRVAMVETLIAQGYSRYLLNDIAEWDGDPYTEFVEAYTLGYTVGLPNILQIPLGNPGQYAAPGEPVQPGQLGAYPSTLPAGWIPVPPMPELQVDGADIPSLLAQWFPPFTPPVPAPPVPNDPVGLLAVGNTYLNAPGAFDDENNYPNGSTFTDSRGTFTHHVIATPFGVESYWSLSPIVVI